jgi:hypothetical protein
MIRRGGRSQSHADEAGSLIDERIPGSDPAAGVFLLSAMTTPSLNMHNFDNARSPMMKRIERLLRDSLSSAWANPYRAATAAVLSSTRSEEIEYLSPIVERTQ